MTNDPSAARIGAVLRDGEAEDRPADSSLVVTAVDYL
jgi:hypothetical protein